MASQAPEPLDDGTGITPEPFEPHAIEREGAENEAPADLQPPAGAESPEPWQVEPPEPAPTPALADLGAPEPAPAPEPWQLDPPAPAEGPEPWQIDPVAPVRNPDAGEEDAERRSATPVQDTEYDTGRNTQPSPDPMEYVDRARDAQTEGIPQVSAEQPPPTVDKASLNMRSGPRVHTTFWMA